MLSRDELRIAVPSKGRLREQSLELLSRAGLRFRVSGRRLFSVCADTHTQVIFSNAQDIPVLVAQGVVDLGITGSDLVLEKGVDVDEHRRLGFGRCRLSLAAHVDAPYEKPEDLAGKVVGTKFVRLASEFFAAQGIEVRLLEIQGAVEVMVLLGLVDAIVEIVETGDSLVENDLVEIGNVVEAESVLIGNASPRDEAARDRLLRRIDGVLIAARWSLLEYNCPADQLEAAREVTPGYSAPTIQQTGDPDWVAVKVMVEKSRLHAAIDALEALGCRALLETDLRHARL